MTVHALLSRTIRRSSHSVGPHRAIPSLSSVHVRSCYYSNYCSASDSLTRPTLYSIVSSGSNSVSIKQAANPEHLVSKGTSLKLGSFCRHFSSATASSPVSYSTSCGSSNFLQSQSLLLLHPTNTTTPGLQYPATTPHLSPPSSSSSPSKNAKLSPYLSSSSSSIFTSKANFHSSKRSKLLNRPLHQVRHCSYQRNMCKHFGVDNSGSRNVPSDRVILPADVKPTYYKLDLEPDFEKFTFDGTVAISYVKTL